MTQTTNHNHFKQKNKQTLHKQVPVTINYHNYHSPLTSTNAIIARLYELLHTNIATSPIYYTLLLRQRLPTNIINSSDVDANASNTSYF